MPVRRTRRYGERAWITFPSSAATAAHYQPVYPPPNPFSVHFAGLDGARQNRHIALMTPVHVVGAGLAGCEAAWQIAAAGVPVVLHEMRPVRMTPSHKTGGLAELVCSNSFRSDDGATNAVGLLHAEMRRLGLLIMWRGAANQGPAGGALAVDREGFSAAVTSALRDHPMIQLQRGEIAGLPPADWDQVIVATGPLT